MSKQPKTKKVAVKAKRNSRTKGYSLSKEFFETAIPAKDFLKQQMGAVKAAKFLKENKKVIAKRGRPKQEQTKVPTSIRLDQIVIEAYKETGSGWQSRVNEDLLRSATVALYNKAHKVAHRAAAGVSIATKSPVPPKKPY